MWSVPKSIDPTLVTCVADILASVHRPEKWIVNDVIRQLQKYDGLGNSAEQARRFAFAVWKRLTDPEAFYPYTIEAFPTAKDRMNKQHKDYLGGGASTDVFAVSVTDAPHKRVALKFFKSGRVDEPLHVLDLFFREVKFNKEIGSSSEYVAPFLGCVLRIEDDDLVLALVSPEADGRSLSAFWARGRDPRLICNLILCVAKGLKFLHRANIIHGDLCAENVLLFGSEPKLSDFGFSELGASGRDSTFTTQCLTTWKRLERVGPVQAKDGQLPARTPKMDIFGFGSFVFQLFAMEAPSFDLQYGTGGNCATPPKPDLMGRDALWNDLWLLLLECWRISPDDRPDAHKLVTQIEIILGKTPSMSSFFDDVLTDQHE